MLRLKTTGFGPQPGVMRTTSALHRKNMVLLPKNRLHT